MLHSTISDFLILFKFVKGVFEFVQKALPEMLPILPLIMEQVFGVNSILMNTTPREFLFDGVHFCKDQDDIAAMVCGLIAQNAPKTIQVNPDKSLRFALYAHVRY